MKEELREPCRAEDVATPALGRVPTRMLDGLPPEIAKRYQAGDDIIIANPILAEGPMGAGKGGTDAQYVRFLQRLLERDMTALQETPPDVINPVFFLQKRG